MTIQTGAHLEVRAAGKNFIHGGEDVRILENVSFEIASGECVALCGKSGIGKSTILRLVAGLIPASTGTITIDRKSIEGTVEKLGFVTQDYSRSLLPWLNVEKNVSLPFRGRKIDKSERVSRVIEALNLVGLADVLRFYPWQLSGGMQQRVAIARALVTRPRLLLLDEPFASLDAHTRMELEDLVSRLVSESGITMLLVTHDIEEAIYMADRVLVLTGSPATINHEIAVKLPRPRDQFETRGLDEFNDLRKALHTCLQK